MAISWRCSSISLPEVARQRQLLDLGRVEATVAVAVEDERLVPVDGAVPVAVEGVEQLVVVDRAVAVGVDDLEVVACVDHAVAVAVRGPPDIAGVDRAVAVEVGDDGDVAPIDHAVVVGVRQDRHVVAVDDAVAVASLGVGAPTEGAVGRSTGPTPSRASMTPSSLRSRKT